MSKKLSKAENYDLNLNKFRYTLFFYFEQLLLCPAVIYTLTVVFLCETTVFFMYMRANISQSYILQYLNTLLLHSFFWIFYAFVYIADKLIHIGIFGHTGQVWLTKQLAQSHITYTQSQVILHNFFTKFLNHWQIYVSLTASTGYVATSIFFAAHGNFEKDNILRGTKIKNLGKIKNIYKFIHKNENKHTFIAGTTGAGKTQTFLNIMSHAFKKDEKQSVRNIIFDLKGDFFCTFYNDYKGDKIVNIFDKRSLKWDFLKDVRDVADLDVLVETFIRSTSASANAQQTGTDQFFAMKSKQFLRDIFAELIKHNFTEAQMVAGRTLALLDEQERMEVKDSCDTNMIKVLKKHKQGASDRAFADTLATVRNAIDFFYFLKFTQKNDGFTINDYLNNNKYRNLYVTVPPDKLDASRQFLSALLEMLLLRMSSLPNTNKLRFRIFIDELSNFTRIPRLINSLNFLRSKGIAIYISTQSFSSLRGSYTQEEIASMLNACNNIIILKLIDAYSTKTASTLIGQRQIIRADKNQFSTPGESKIDGFTLQQHTVTENAVLDSEIASLGINKNYTEFFAYLNNEWCKGKLKLWFMNNKTNDCLYVLPNAMFNVQNKEGQQQKQDSTLDIKEQKEVKKQAQKQHEQEKEEQEYEEKHKENIEDIDIFNLR